MSTEKAIPEYFGRYQVLEELGSGAMGVVYLCVDARLTRPVAIKVLRQSEQMTPSEREQYLARFRQEAEAAGRMSHPDIVQIYDIGPSYLVMEFLEGRPLSSLMRSGAVFTVSQVCMIVKRVADAIDYAHKQGIIHRDIKPANIMLLDDGGVKVMDFGVARLESSTLTAVGTVVGSVRYMAPEQMMGEKLDGRADVFSLGAVAYELLTGCAPFPGKTITEVVSRVVHGAHVPPAQVNSRLPEALDRVFARAFVIRREERYSRCLDFANDLTAAAKGVLTLEIRHGGDEPAPTQIQGAMTTVLGASSLEETIVPGAARAERDGVLLIDSDPPGARVLLDGAPVGQTPLSGTRAPLGAHAIRLEAAGHDPVSVSVELTAERPLQAVTIVLSAATSPAVSPGEFSGDLTPPRRISGTLAAAPDEARRRAISGSPVVEFWVTESGDVRDPAIVYPAHPVLDAAVLQAVSTWRFAPALRRGVPAAVRMTLQHHFKR